jgi:hypothetical protein
MKFLTQLSLGAMLVAQVVPSAVAKIYPDDFIIDSFNQPQSSSSSSAFSSSSSRPSDTHNEDDALFFASEIPSGGLTRAEFADAVATRLFNASEHDSCYADLSPLKRSLLCIVLLGTLILY